MTGATTRPPVGMTRVAAVDCGTNSLRLLVADVDPDADGGAGRLVEVRRETRIVRLGQGVDATGALAPEAVERALAVTAEYARCCAQDGAERVRFVATSATRDARNADAFAAGVRRVLGVGPQVLTGPQEARLSFAGAVRGLAGAGTGPVLVVDLGGGSTEFVLGAADRPGHVRVAAAASVDVGSVRITERHLAADPPPPSGVAAARADVAAALAAADAEVGFARAATLVGVAGTVTTLTAHALGLDAYDRSRVHGAVLPVEAVRAACRDLAATPRAARAALPYVPPGRADVIGAGALIWDLVVERVARAAGLALVTTSEHDILDGVAWELARS